MRRKILLVSSILMATAFACSTIQPKTTAKVDYKPEEIHTVLSEIDTITSIDSSAEALEEKDSLAFLKIHKVDVRYDINDSINTNFSNNLDSLLHLWYVEHQNLQNEPKDLSAPIEKLSDSVYIKRLERIPSIIDLSYNKIVKNYIELYSKKRRSQVEYMMGMSEYYFPIFEEILDKEGLPQELKYLPIIESALNPKALSRAGASGLWQFMYGTGRMYKLDINSFIDERRDPVKSTYAAVKYLKDMYKVYKNWHLVIAAYNCGPGNVNKAIRRSGGKRNYWDIYYRLPRETRGYVPAFIAAIYTFNYHKEHNLFPKQSNFPIACDTLMIDETLHFDQVAHVLNISKEQLRELNPQYRADIIPGGNKAYALKIPLRYTSKFIDLQDSIFAYKKEYYFSQKDKVVNPRDRYQKFAHVVPKNKAKVYYKVKPGDAVGLIASWFHVRTSDLRYWNNIRRNLIKVGQNLVVYVPKSKADYYKGFNRMSYAQKQASLGKKVNSTPAVKSSPVRMDASYVYYTVRRGDNFWTIAKKFPGVSNYDIMKLNNISNARSLKVGQKLKIKQKS